MIGCRTIRIYRLALGNHRLRKWFGSSTQQQHHRVFTRDSQQPNYLVDVTGLANEIRGSVRAFTESIETKQRPRLAGILASDIVDDAAFAYSNQIQKTFSQDGLHYEEFRCSGDRPEAVEAVIHQCNAHSEIHGILVFYPIFPQRTADVVQDRFYVNPSNGVHYLKPALPFYLDAATGVHYKTIDDFLRDCVVSTKDVEGLSHERKWQRQLFRTRTNRDSIYIPCTAMAVWKILEAYSPGWKAYANVTIINRSTILGRPLAALMASEGVANVYSVDERSILHYEGRRMRRSSMMLQDCLKDSHIVITAVPDGNFQIVESSLRENTMVIDAAGSNIDQKEVMAVPGRGIRLVSTIGKVTIAVLEQSLIRLFEAQKG